jgi:peptidoglycan/xylan/chitin deacetylase (PgdA/CDA1 family)
MKAWDTLRVIFPFYHTVNDKELIHLKNLYHVRSTKEFRRDLDFLLKYFAPIGVSELIRAVENPQTIKKRSFLLTFDDGLREMYDTIAPILKEKGIPAVFFVNTSFVNNCDLFFRYKASILVETIRNKELSAYTRQKCSALLRLHSFSTEAIIKAILSVNYDEKSRLDSLAKELNISFSNYLNSVQPYLTDLQIKSLISDGFMIGAHSTDHPQYSDIPLETQIWQTQESIEFVQEHYNPAYRLFSFPFTDNQVSTDYFNNIFNIEKPVADLTFGTAGLKTDSCLRNIQRIPMEKNKASAFATILFQYFYWMLKIPLGKNKIQRIPLK